MPKLVLTRRLLQLAPTCLLVLFSHSLAAQSAGRLYDPEPPEDSAYVRVIIASPTGSADVQVDGQIRQRKLAAGEAGDYLVLPAGKHHISLHAPGKAAVLASHPLEVVAGKALSVAFAALRADAVPIVFEDKSNTNKLRALLAVYHLAPKAGALDIATADGKTKVFNNLLPGSSNALPVNPINIDLMASAAGDKAALAQATLSMAQGNSYSVLLLPTTNNKLQARVFQNKTERYTGK